MAKQIGDLITLSFPSNGDFLLVREVATGLDKKLVYENLLSSMVPPGMILPYGGDGLTPPTGYLLCDGSAVSRTTYASLFGAIGTRWGEGDGSTTFHLPDGRGEHLRGVDHGEGNDPDAGSRTASASGGATGDNVGTKQADAFQGHWHDSIGFLGAGAATAFSYGAALEGADVTMDRDNIQDSKSDGVNGVPRTTSETRGRNVAVDYMIKT